MSSKPATWDGYTDRRHVIATSGTWNAYTLDGIVSGGTHLGGFTTITDNGVTRSPIASEYNQGTNVYMLWVYWDGTTHHVLGLMQGRDGDVRFGPTFAQLKSNYGASGWWQTPANFNEVTGKQGFQLWTIPKTGTYRITAKGAQGGRTDGLGTYNNSPGNGAHIMADIALMRGTKIVIIVGQAGEYPRGNQNSISAAGGGGATWILKENFTTANDQVYMVAGGGAGAERSNTNHTVGSADGSSQGTLGGGGAGNGWNYGDGGGAGWTGNGTGTNNSGGLSPTNGAAGGNYGSVGNTSGYASVGGFGGGGGGGLNVPGGGGGASGGRTAIGATPYDSTGSDNSQGGTSYIMPSGTGGITVTNPTFSGNHTDADGSVHIELLT